MRGITRRSFAVLLAVVAEQSGTVGPVDLVAVANHRTPP